MEKQENKQYETMCTVPDDVCSDSANEGGCFICIV